MNFESIRSNKLITDEEFDSIYPAEVKRLSKVHWTPIDVAKKATEWLVKNKSDKILDIGSGAGKFCFVAAIISGADITGIEQRKYFVDVCKKIQSKEQIKNVKFIHDDIKNINLGYYKGLYFYNSFHELILDDDSVLKPALISEQLYFDYSHYLYEQFETLELNTRLVTYYGHINQVPNNYRLVDSAFNNELKLWIKQS